MTFHEQLLCTAPLSASSDMLMNCGGLDRGDAGLDVQETYVYTPPTTSLVTTGGEGGGQGI